jgi:hypothetical protein
MWAVSPWCTHRNYLFVKILVQFSCGCEQFHWGRSFGFLVINLCNHGEHYETPCTPADRTVCLYLHTRYISKLKQVSWNNNNSNDNSVMGTVNSSDRTAATMYSLGTWFVSGIYV